MAKRNKGLSTPPVGAYDVPFVANNTVRSMFGQRSLLVAVLEVGDGYLCIEYQLGISQVVLIAIKKSHFNTHLHHTEDDLSEVTSDLKSKALTRGATLEAIQLLGQLTPLTLEEEAEMAKSPAAKAADTSKLSKKNEAKAAPVAKAAKEGGAGRAPAEFDYKVVKGAKNEAREGSWTHHMVETILTHTSTKDARAANAKAKGATPKGEAFSDKALDFAWAKAKGYITY